MTDLVREILIFSGTDAVFAFLFYRSFAAWICGLAVFPLYIRLRRREILRRRRIRMREEFLTGAQMAATAIQAGYAPENAFREALAELRKVYAENDYIVTEFSRIVTGCSLHIPLEKLLEDMAVRSGVADIERFADVFMTARRAGGNIAAILRDTVSVISQKEEVRKEVETMIAGKKTEASMMSVIPLGILAYVGLTGPGFIAPMYHTAAGMLIMTAALAIYAASWFWGRQIVRIEI